MSIRSAAPLALLLSLLLPGAAAAATATPATEAPAEPLAGQRLEQAELSASVVLPEDWTIESSYGDSHGQSADGLAWCALNGSRPDEPVEDPDALLERVAEIYPALPDGGPLPVIDRADLQLPAGRSIRLIVDLGPTTAEDPEDQARFTTTYLLTDPHRMLIFSCWSEERADDDWLAVAETIELAPVDR